MKKKTGRGITPAMLMVVLMIVLSACGGGSQQGGQGTASSGEDGVLRIAMSQDIVTMDAHLTTNDYLIPMNTLITSC